jgi:hypothetical protein
LIYYYLVLTIGITAAGIIFIILQMIPGIEGVGGRGTGRCGWYGWGWRQEGEMTQALYAHMNNKKIKIKKKMIKNYGPTV